jgi:hypothetical protein
MRRSPKRAPPRPRRWRSQIERLNGLVATFRTRDGSHVVDLSRERRRA